METNFFSILSSLHTGADWNIIIRQGADQKLIVSVLLNDQQVKDPAKNNLQPFNFEGSPADFDSQFFASLATPVQQVTAFFTNAKTHEASLKKAQEAAKMNAPKPASEKQSPEDKAKEERAKQFVAKMNKVEEYEQAKQIQLAIAALPKPEQFPEQKEQINLKLEDLRKQNQQLSLL